MRPPPGLEYERTFTERIEGPLGPTIGSDDLDAIADRFAEDATWSIHGTPRIPADTAWRPAGALPPMASDRASIVGSARSGCAPSSPQCPRPEPEVLAPC